MGDNNADICNNYITNIYPTLHSDVTKETRIIYLVYAIVLFVYATLGFIVFVVNKNKVVYLKQKSTFAQFTIYLGTVLATVAYPLREYIGRDKYPCVAFLWVHHVPMLFMACQPIGVMYFYIYKLREERTKTLAIKKMFSEDVEAQSQSSFDPASPAIFAKQSKKVTSWMTEVADFFFVMRHSKNGRIVVGNEEPDNRDAEKSTLGVVSTPKPNMTTAVESGNHSMSKTQRNLLEQIGLPLMMMILFGFPYLILTAVRINYDPISRAGCYGCFLGEFDAYMKIASGILYIPMAASGVYAMRNEPDPLRVFKEVHLGLNWSNIVVIGWFVNLASALNGMSDRAIVNAVEIVGVAGVFYAYTLSGYVKYLFDQRKVNKSSNQHRVRDQSLSVSPTANREYSLKNPPPYSAIDLNLVLLEPKARNAFLEHSVNEISSENVVFVFKLRAWKSMWDKEKPEKITKIAVQLFKEYISKESKSPINIPFTMYNRLENELLPYLGTSGRGSARGSATQTVDEEAISRLRSFSNKPRKDVFDECEKECVMILEHDALPRFCQSKLFKTEILEAGILNKVLKQ